MARRRRAIKRIIPQDTRYNKVVVAKFINRLMKNGKKTIAQRIFYQAMDQIENDSHRDPVEMFEQAVRNATPMVQVRSRRVGGATYPIPTELSGERGMALSMMWLIKAARDKKGKAMAERLAQELQEASRGQGVAVKRREDLHRMAEANRAFAHYRW